MMRAVTNGTWTLALAGMTLALAGCPGNGDDPGDVAEPVPALGEPPQPGLTAGDVEPVRFEVFDRAQQRVAVVALSEDAHGVAVHVRGVNLLPAGPRGIHFHETGRCDLPDFESAGGHFAPEGRQHGLENPQGPHAGDLPNLPVLENGTVDTTFITTLVTLRPGEPHSLLDGDGTALVIHARADDQRTDPAGNSGDRVACGVVAREGAPG
jgi:superoxide dismutase, Cu-Zn family